MNKPTPLDADGEIIDVSPGRPRRRKRWWWFLILAVVALIFLASRGLSIYVSALWFGSLGYAQVYWYMFRLKIELFVTFFLITVVILRGGFWLIERAFAPFAFDGCLSLTYQALSSGLLNTSFGLRIEGTCFGLPGLQFRDDCLAAALGPQGGFYL